MNTAAKTPPIRIVIVEDFDGIREDIASLIHNDPDFELTGVARCGAEALRVLREVQPDIVLMDIGLPDLSGVDCVRQLRAELPATEFMMLTVFTDHDTVMAALEAGATGYLVKSASWDRLREAIRELHSGGSPMSSSIARAVLSRLVEKSEASSSRWLESGLSLREEEVLRALAKGHRYKEIAAELEVSPYTVRAHIHAIYKKLHVRSKAEAVATYRRQAFRSAAP